MIITTPNGNFLSKLILTLRGRGYIYKGKEHPNIFSYKQLEKILSPHLLIERVYYNMEQGFFSNIKTLLASLKISSEVILILKKK
jgi:hypothetical protein